MQTVQCFFDVAIKNPNRYIIANGDREEHQQWIIDNCRAPDEKNLGFVNFELPIVIDKSGWYAGNNSLFFVNVTESGTIYGYKIGSLLTSEKEASRILARLCNNENSPIYLFDCTGRQGYELDNQVIFSKFEF